MDKVLSVRLPEVLAAKVERLAAAEGMNFSELVRAALRLYLAERLNEAHEVISREVWPQLQAEGVTEENVEAWYKQQRKKIAAEKKTAVEGNISAGRR